MFTVVITEKGGVQRRMEFAKPEVTIGRVQGNDIILPKGNVSKRHSRIVVKDRRFIVVDLKSTNGTYVNGRKITSPLVVKTGDKIYVGDFILSIDGEPPADEAGSAALSPPSGGSSRAIQAPPSFHPPTPASSSNHPSEPGAATAEASPATSRPPPLRPSSAGMPAVAENTEAPFPPTSREPAASNRATSIPSMRATLAPSKLPPPPRTLGPNSVSSFATTPPKDFDSALRFVMARLSMQVDVHDAEAESLHDQDRWSHAQGEIERIVGQMQSDGSLPSSVESQELAATALREAVGLGPLELLMADEKVREIIVEGPRQILADLGEGLKPFQGVFSSAAALLTVARRLVAQAGEILDPARPTHETTLPYGPHVTVVQPPVAVRGPILEVRRIARGMSADDLVKKDMLTAEMLGILKRIVTARKNIVVMGPVGSGVTSVVGALAGLSPVEDRMVVVEALPDMSLERNHVVTLATGGVGSGVSFRDVLEQGCRLRSDRMIIDDVRGGEAFDALTSIAVRASGNFMGVHAPPQGDPVGHLKLLCQLNSKVGASALTELIGAAVHVLVQVAKTEDGRKVIGITELTGVQDDILQRKDLFFHDGKFRATGNASTHAQAQ